MNNAGIIEKIVVEGTIKTESPLLIGTGENDGVIDTMILKDKQARPFIPGTSLAGVLRECLYSAEPDDELADRLFGKIARNRQLNDRSYQSAIIVEDIILRNAKTIIRDGVGIDNFTGVGKDGAKYDYEAVDRGAKGDFSLVVTLRACHAEYRGQLEAAVKKLADIMMGGISIGALTTKGFGRVVGEAIIVKTYDFTNPASVRDWLLGNSKSCPIYQAVASDVWNENDFVLAADFAINGSLIVRGEVDDDMVVDSKQVLSKVQLKSGNDYVIPGTTVKGIIKKQAQRIFSKMDKNEKLLDDLLGYSNDDVKQKSRLYTEEIYFKAGTKTALHSRNRIDRFTGGTVDGALFTNQPVWQEEPDKPVLCLKFRVKDCKAWEAGLMLFILRDIWTGNVAFGGEKSIGRGTLSGVKARINYHGKYVLTASEQKLLVEGDKNQLEKYAEALFDEDGGAK